MAILAVANPTLIYLSISQQPKPKVSYNEFDILKPNIKNRIVGYRLGVQYSILVSLYYYSSILAS